MLTILLIIVIILLLVYGISRRTAENKEILEFMSVWVDHLFYTRLVFMEFLNDGPALPQLKQRLLQNQVDIGKVFGNYYGQDNGSKLTTLLTQHIVLAVDVLTAIKDNKDHKAAVNEFYKNAGEIGSFIDFVKGTGIMFQEHMKTHIDTLIATVTAYVAKDWASDIKHTDEYLHSGLQMAFMM